mmetsp:Transcript_41833/g.94104  ORF Transcript_41833/g.94104 Transcript_41833/m.94104 type:complete len:155 (-) Transcript_41833:794-1258(-)
MEPVLQTGNAVPDNLLLLEARELKDDLRPIICDFRLSSDNKRSVASFDSSLFRRGTVKAPDLMAPWSMGLKEGAAVPGRPNWNQKGSSSTFADDNLFVGSRWIMLRIRASSADVGRTASQALFHGLKLGAILPSLIAIFIAFEDFSTAVYGKFP